MSVVEHLLLAVHLLAMATVVGGWVAVRHQPRVTPAMVWGARTLVVTGLLLVWAVTAAGDDVDNAKIGVKLVVALAVAGCAEIGNARRRRDGSDQAGLASAAAGLAVVNVLVAVLWS